MYSGSWRHHLFHTSLPPPPDGEHLFHKEQVYIDFLFGLPRCHTFSHIEGPGSGWWRARGASASLQRGVPLCKQVPPFKEYICYFIFLASIRES